MRQGLLWLSCLLVGLPASAWAGGASTDREHLVTHALDVLGVQFRYGGRSPETGFDCSGLVAYTFERAWGLQLPRTTELQKVLGTPVKRNELKPGDLVFHNTRNRPFSHVGIYLGEGRFVHAPRTGASVRVESVQTPYWQSRFNGARRVDPPTF